MTCVRNTAAVQFVHKALKQLTMEEGISPWEKEKEGGKKKEKKEERKLNTESLTVGRNVHIGVC